MLYVILQVDLQRKVEERNRLLAEYKVMEPLFTGGFAWGQHLVILQFCECDCCLPGTQSLLGRAPWIVNKLQ